MTQILERPERKPPKTLTQRLAEGISKGRRLRQLAAEIDGQDLDLATETLCDLRDRLRDEMSERAAMANALTKQIGQRPAQVSPEEE